MKEIEGAHANTQKVLSLLDSLNHFSVNMSILKATKVGKKMSKLSQSKDPEISKAANGLVSKWKKQIESSRSKNQNSKKEGQASKTAAMSQEEPSSKLAEEAKKSEVSAPPARVREADLAAESGEFEQHKQEDVSNEEYEEFVSQNYTSDGIRQNIRKGINELTL
jgi:hypothetical protein